MINKHEIHLLVIQIMAKKMLKIHLSQIKQRRDEMVSQKPKVESWTGINETKRKPVSKCQKLQDRKVQ